jgi:hypothetical protein
MGLTFKGGLNLPQGGFKTRANQPPIWDTAAGSLGSANGNAAYSFQLAAHDPDNGVPTFSLYSGPLPNGLTISSAGLISGTPTTYPQVFNFGVMISDGAFSEVRYFSLDITNDTPVWVTTGGSLGTININTSVNVTFSATDPNNDTVTYSVVSGTIPSGTSLSSAGALTGTASAGGTYNFTVRADDGHGGQVDRAFSMVVNDVMTSAWDPAKKYSSITLSNGNRTMTTTTTGHYAALAVSGYSTGKKYFEITFGTSIDYTRAGIAPSSFDKSAYSENYIGFYRHGGTAFSTVAFGGWSAYSYSFNAGERLMFAYDLSAGKWWFGKGGVWAQGNPATGTSPLRTWTPGATLYPMGCPFNTTSSITIHSDALYLPSGFTLWS